MKNPCYNDGADCPRRQAGCARSCAAWAEYCVERDKIRKKRNEAAEIDALTLEGRMHAKIKRMKKRRGR